MYCFRPNVPLSSLQRSPAVVFFHGGKFDRRLSSQFATQCLHFASRGILAFAVEYRVNEVNGTGPMEALEDARTFMNYLAYHQEHFTVDLNKIVVGGASSGGMLALHLASRHKNNLAFIGDLPRPCGLVLYAPISNTTKKGICSELFPDDAVSKRVSPSEQLEKNAPPIIVFHGKADNTVPFGHSEKLVKGWQKKKNQAELIEFETARHIDFNLNVNPQIYELALKSADYFLTNLGIIQPDPNAFLD